MESVVRRTDININNRFQLEGKGLETSSLVTVAVPRSLANSSSCYPTTPPPPPSLQDMRT